MDRNEEIWSQILNDLAKDVGSVNMSTWFDNSRLALMTTDFCVIEFMTDFAIKHVQRRYHNMIRDSIENVTGNRVEIEYRLSDDPLNNNSVKGTSIGNLNHIFTFDNFVVGKSNQFSHAACISVAESPGEQFNPLFIYGNSGLGKTHLMQAIGNHILEHNPELVPAYLTSEQFTNEMVDSIRTDTTLEFRERYRNVDLLLIDDIQFLIGKEGTQEEFFHTFNELYQNKKQIVVTSDKPPKDLKGLESRLITRLGGGLITDIVSPDLETRIAILKNKNDREGFEVPDDVIYFIAERIDSNIRELEGALTSVRALSNLLGDDKEITIDFAQEALKNILDKEVKIVVDADRIKSIVAHRMNLTVEELESKRRTQDIAYARHIAMYLCRDILDLSLPNIGNEFGGRDHTTVIHGDNRIKELIKEDPSVKELVQSLKDEIIS